MSKLIIEMKMPKRCFDCPMHDWTYGLHETRQNVLVCNARHELTPILCQTIPNGDERPDWCPINGVLPEQHGDLIDRDALKGEISVLLNTEIIPWATAKQYADIAKNSALMIIDDQRPIIQATERSKT